MPDFPTPDPTTPHDPDLPAEALRQAIETLDAKIRTLHNRTNATAAGSDATYEEHAAALEAKRDRLAEQLSAKSDPTDNSIGPVSGVPV